jgi:hypothetical protein
MMIEVHVLGSGWREFKEANAWGMHADGTMRLVKTSGPPKWGFERWVAVFPPGGWQGMAHGDNVKEDARYGFKLGGQPPY